MKKLVVYKTEADDVVVLIPTDEAVQKYGVLAVAQKDVPPGVPFKIITQDDLPADRTFRAAWDIDATTLVDGVGADYGFGSSNEVVGWNNGVPVVRG